MIVFFQEGIHRLYEFFRGACDPGKVEGFWVLACRRPGRVDGLLRRPLAPLARELLEGQAFVTTAPGGLSRTCFACLGVEGVFESSPRTDCDTSFAVFHGPEAELSGEAFSLSYQEAAPSWQVQVRYVSTEHLTRVQPLTEFLLIR